MINDLSPAGVLKWLCIILGAVIGGMGVRSMIIREAMLTRSQMASGHDAVLIGIKNLGIGIAFMAAALGFWFFWQRHEE